MLRTRDEHPQQAPSSRKFLLVPPPLEIPWLPHAYKHLLFRVLFVGGTIKFPHRISQGNLNRHPTLSVLAATM